MKTAAILATLLTLAVLEVTGNEHYESFLTDYQDWKHSTKPEEASLQGLHQFDTALGDTSPEGAEAVRFA